MLTIHILTSSQYVYDLYIKIQRHYPISKIIMLHEREASPDIIESIKKVESDCELRGLKSDVYTFDPTSIESEINAIINIRKTYPDDHLYFNITPGKKSHSIIAFMASIWVNGICYYWPDDLREPMEFPVPRISLQDLSTNQLHLEIIKLLYNKKQMTQSAILHVIKVNPNNNATLSAQALSQSIKYLKKYGLVDVKRAGRITNVSLTLSGRLAYSMIYSE